MKIDRQLLKKYNQSGPRYTSYPPATFFSTDASGDTYQQHLIESNKKEPQAASLYIHIPFCKKLCHFCGCNSIATPQKNIVDEYVSALCSEIQMVAEHINKTRTVTQIHWGGGTPHSIPMDSIHEIMEVVYDNFSVDNNTEIAMECNPAYTDLTFFEELRNIGFNRVSLGIQDFDVQVLKIVNRDESQLPHVELVNHIKELGFGLNLDLIYGLPGQTLESFIDNLNRVCELDPDRLVTFSYAHVPWVKKAQKILEKHTLPDADAKLAMLEAANTILNEAGYISIGLDHFAKPDDELNIALKRKQLHRNFQGYCTKATTGQVYAFGTSGISQFADSYFQNIKDTQQYIDLIKEKRFPIEKGYVIDDQDVVVRELITDLMCNLVIDFGSIQSRYKVNTHLLNYLNVNKDVLSDLEKDKLVIISEDRLEVTPKGIPFLRNIAMLFDPKLHDISAVYSKTI